MMTAEISLQRTLGNVEDEIDENDDAGRCKSSQIFTQRQSMMMMMVGGAEISQLLYTQTLESNCIRTA